MHIGPLRGGPLASKSRAALTLLFSALLFAPALHAQEVPIHLETSSGAAKLRLGVSTCKPGSVDPGTLPEKSVFDQTLFNDLSNAGIFELVSREMAPKDTPG